MPSRSRISEWALSNARDGIERFRSRRGIFRMTWSLRRPTHGRDREPARGGAKGAAMRVQEIMVSSPLTCGPESNLAEVANLMWKGDCGIVPVTDTAGKLLGV